MSKKEDVQITKHILNIGISTVINLVLGLVTTPIITRIVNPIEYGKLTMFNSYIAVSLSFVYFGLEEALIRFFYSYKNKNEQKSLLKLCVNIPLIFTIIASIIFVILCKNHFVDLEYPMIIVVLLCVDLFFSVWNKASTEMLQITYQSKKYSLTAVTQKIAYCILAIGLILVVKNNYFLMLVIATTISTLVSAGLGTYFTKDYWSFKDNKYPNNINEILRYSTPLYCYLLLMNLFDVTDKYLVKHFCGDYEIGIYGSAVALVGIFSLIQTIFVIMWKPMQTDHYCNNPDDTSFIQKGNRYVTIIMFFVGINVIMFKDILCLMLGSDYRGAESYIPFLVFNPVMYTIADTVTSGIEKSKKTYLHVIIIVICFAIEIFGSVYLIPRIGAKGAAISLAISLIVLYLLRLLFSNLYYPIDYGLKKTLVLILITLVFAYINTFYKFSILTLVVYFVCLAILVALYFKDIKEMIDMFKTSLLNKQ